MSIDAATELPVIVHKQPDARWLQASREEPLLPELPILDAHHHFSEHWGGYMPPDLVADAQGHNLRATVYIQCAWRYRQDGPEHLKPVGEVEAVVAATRNGRAGSPRIAAGIVGYADLRHSAVDEILFALEQASDGRLRGIRNSGAWHSGFRHGVLARPMKGLYGDPAFRGGYGRLAHHGLSFDAWIYHPQILEVAELARAFPDVPLVLDHIGGLLGVGDYQDDPERARKEWEARIRVLAACPNVHVKIGGFGTAVFGYDFVSQPRPPSSEQLAREWQPLVDTTLDLFGSERCMFESNFPVDRSLGGYGVLWNAFKRVASGLSESERRALFHDNAARLYRIPAT
ncbi:MAG: amidohydrolase [Ramlibacter sp.]|jgi:predicted TIM-barrel fold metal-dependent hydrolase|nr:amidohydrolase [Ramlibacter sp.]